MNKPSNSKALQAVMNDATPHELLRLARLVRKTCVDQIRDTQCVLDPAKLRELDASIARIEARLN